MATLTITCPDAQAARVRDAFALVYHRPVLVDGQPNPESKTQFTLRMLREFVKNVVKQAEAPVAADAARATALAAVDNDVVLT